MDKDHCWAVGGGGTILHTTNGGRKWLGFFGGWKKQESGTWADLDDVFFLDAQHGWAVGGSTILHTTDGGKSWKVLAKGLTKALSGVHFVTPQEGWVVGMNKILHTTNGGKTWQIEEIGTQWLYKVHFVDRRTGWIIGGNGTILRYKAEGGN